MTEQPSLFAGGIPASRKALPGSDEARKTTVSSGLLCLISSKTKGPLGSLEKMLLGTSAWGSTLCFLTWQVKTTPLRRLIFRLALSAPRTDEKESGFLPTMTAADSHGHAQGPVNRTLPYAARLWPTASARDWKDSPGMSQDRVNPDGSTRKRTDQLARAVYFWPTPDAQCHKNARAPENVGTFGGKNQSELQGVVAFTEGKGQREDLTTAQKNGQLSPDWVEWLMGYPIGWTDLQD